MAINRIRKQSTPAPNGVGSVGAVTAKDGSQISTGASTPGLLTTAGLRLEAGSTLVVPPGATARVAASGNIIMTLP